MGSFSANQALVKASSFEKKGKPNEACNLYLKVLNNFPKNTRAVFGLTRTHEFLVSKHVKTLRRMLAEGKTDSVLVNAQVLTKEYTHSFSLWGLLGESFYRNGQLIESITCYQQVLRIKPDFPQAFNNIANALLDIGDLDSAITHYKKAIKIKPSYSNALANLGSALTQKKDYKNAVIYLEEAIKIDPKNAENYNRMALAQLSKGDLEEAIRSFKTVLRIDPQNMKAQHLLAASTGVNTNSAPKKYVEGLFDYYATNFESSLVQKLQYTVPEAIAKLAITNNSNESLGSILDLGCGTGLVGLNLKHSCNRLEGIDLSQKMLNQAQSKNVYDNLTHVDILEYLKTADLNFNYYFAADVFIYIGNLSDVFYLIKHRNKSPGKLLFSTEHNEKDGFFLEKSGRYSHSESYIKTLCDEFDYQLHFFSKVNLRKEGNEFVLGGMYLLEF